MTLIHTRKYPLRGYILSVLTHTTAWDQYWGGDGTLKSVLIFYLDFASPNNITHIAPILL